MFFFYLPQCSYSTYNTTLNTNSTYSIMLNTYSTYNTIQYNTIQCNTIQNSTKQYNAKLTLFTMRKLHYMDTLTLHLKQYNNSHCLEKLMSDELSYRKRNWIKKVQNGLSLIANCSIALCRKHEWYTCKFDRELQTAFSQVLNKRPMPDSVMIDGKTNQICSTQTQNNILFKLVVTKQTDFHS